MGNELDYTKAAHIIAVCPKSRLGVVASTLSAAGYEIDYSALLKLVKTDGRGSAESLRKRHGVGKKKDWNPSTNEVTLKLREAHEAGVNISELSRMVGLDRVTLYHYLWGTRKPSEKNGKAVLDAIEVIYIRDAIPESLFF